MLSYVPNTLESRIENLDGFLRGKHISKKLYLEALKLLKSGKELHYVIDTGYNTFRGKLKVLRFTIID